MNTIDVQRYPLELLEQYRVEVAQSKPRVVQQKARNQLVDTRAMGKPPAFSGDLDEAGRPVDGFSWSQRSERTLVSLTQ